MPPLTPSLTRDRTPRSEPKEPGREKGTRAYMVGPASTRPEPQPAQGRSSRSRMQN